MSYDGKEMVDDKDNQTKSWKAVWQRKKKQNKNQKTWIILSVFRYRLLGSIGVISYHKLWKDSYASYSA